MKRIISTLLVLSLVFMLVSCGTKQSQDEKQQATYSNEIDYLLLYPGMTLENFTAAENPGDLSNATYTVKNGDYNTFLTKYEEILKNDGWKTVVDKKPDSINLEKDNHIVLISPLKITDGLKILIMTR